MLKRPFSPSGADCAATRPPLSVVTATIAATHHDLVDDFAGLIALSATPRSWHIIEFYTRAGKGASLGPPESAVKSAFAKSTMAAAPLIPEHGEMSAISADRAESCCGAASRCVQR
jgi:hypothetical protein